MSRLRSLFSAALVAASLSPVFAQTAPVAQTPAEPGPWSVRLHATYLQTMDRSSGALGKNAISVSDKFIPEFDIGYRINASWSLELVLTVPQEHDVKLNGAKIGDFEHLPPTFFVQYTPQVSEVFRPYLGAGVNFTFIMDDDLAGGAAKLDSFSVGPAVQAGFDIQLADRWALNFDVKRIMIRSDVEIGGTKVAEVKLDPWLYSAGVTYRF